MARARGVTLDDKTRDALKRDIVTEKYTRAALCKKHGVSPPTVSRWADELGVTLPRPPDRSAVTPERKTEWNEKVVDKLPGNLKIHQARAIVEHENLKEKCRTLLAAIDQPPANGPRRARDIAMAAIAVRALVEDDPGPLRIIKPTGADAIVARAKEVHGDGDDLKTVLYEHVTFLSMEVRRLEAIVDKKRERLAAPSPRS